MTALNTPFTFFKEQIMKLLISADMEGIAGVVDPTHVTSTHPEYQRFRRIMTDEVNAAIRGAFAGGADEVVVSDAHGNKTNILVEALDERAEINSGGIAPFGMVQGIDESFDAAMFIGYHARMGAPNAILSHTISGKRVANIWLNDRPTGEFGLNASVCGYYGAPVILVGGDLAACQEADSWVPGIDQVVVKKGTSRHSAQCLSTAKAHRLMEKTAEKAVKRFLDGGGPPPLQVAAPVKITLEFHQAAMADGADGLPGAVRLDGRRLEMESLDMPTAYRTLKKAISLGAG
jgi:D-amino peptidase